MLRRLFSLLFLLPAAGAQAAGHFDIDDAATLDSGQCQYEAWGGRFGAEPFTSLHLGPACRVGPVELRLNIERDSALGQHADLLGPQLKWTFVGQGDDARFAAALSLSATYDLTHGGRAGGQFVVPVSWRALDSLWLNANLGADWLPGSGARSGRGGLQAAWSLDERVTLVAERFRAFGAWSSRAGLRFSLTPLISLDISAVRSGSTGVRGYAIGLNHEFHGL